MTTLAYYTDEDVHSAAAIRLREAGVDAVSNSEAGNFGLSDEQQLDWATRQLRVIVSFNSRDFCRIHYVWTTTGRSHAGIVVSKQRPVGDLVKRLILLAHFLSAEEMQNHLEFLSGRTSP